MEAGEVRRLELIANKGVLGRCNHVNFESVVEREFGHTFHIVRCSDCGVHTQEPQTPLESQSFANARAIQLTIPHHFGSMMMANRVIRELERVSSWKIGYRSVDGFTTSLFKNAQTGQLIESRPAKEQIDAVVDVFAKLFELQSQLRTES